VIIFGHRGAPGYPRQGENTIASFRKALRCGATGLEFDVRRCGDGSIVVIHDETIDRTTSGRGRVANLSYEQLRRFDAGAGERIPLLTDVLDEFGAQCLLNIELKDAGIADEVKKLVIQRNLEKQVIISSFDWPQLGPALPEIPIALLSSEPKNLVSAAHEFGAAAIHPRKDIVTARLLRAAREANLKIHVWTVNDPTEVSAFRDMGLDGLFSDFPEKCLMPPL